MASHNIKYQLIRAVNARHDIGNKRSKHQDKIQETNPKRDIVYGTKEFKRLKDIIKMFYSFMQEKHSDLCHKQLGDIKTLLWEEFLDSKKTTCNQNALDGYASSIKKIARCVNAYYLSVNNDWEFLKVPESSKGKEALRQIRPSRKFYNCAISLLQDSYSKTAIELAATFALRVSETVKMKPKDIDFETMTLTVFESKGDKTRYLKIKPNEIALLKKAIKNKEPDELVCPIKEDTVNTTLSRMWKRFDIRYGTNYHKIFKDAKTGIHALRKMKATELYEEELERLVKERLAQKQCS